MSRRSHGCFVNISGSCFSFLILCLYYFFSWYVLVENGSTYGDEWIVQLLISLNRFIFVLIIFLLSISIHTGCGLKIEMSCNSFNLISIILSPAAKYISSPLTRGHQYLFTILKYIFYLCYKYTLSVLRNSRIPFPRNVLEIS